MPLRRNSLPVLMAVAQAGLIVLTALAIGIPSILAIRQQFVYLAGKTLEQAGRTAQALVDEQRQDLQNLAQLIAQRPTLSTLLASGETEQMEDYLGTLQQSTGLDLLVLCGTASQPLAQVGDPAEPWDCSEQPVSGLKLILREGQPDGWMLASQPVAASQPPAWIVAGQRLDRQYAQDIQNWVGLETAIFVDRHLLATSLDGQLLETDRLRETLEDHRPQAERFSEDGIVTIGNESYYYLDSMDAASGLDSMFLLPAAEIARAEQELIRSIGIAILVVVLLGTALGYWGAWQISRPLSRLRTAADRLRKGDLVTPITLSTPVMEVNQVANALEAARNTLQHSQRQLQQEKDWVQYLLESVVEGILTVDRRGRIAFFSQGAEHITGWSADQALGQGLDDVFRVVEDEIPFSQRIPPPGGRQKIVVQLAGGRRATLAVSGAGQAPPAAGKTTTVLVLRDVSDEETIRRLLGEFLANIAHEFRTPLSALAASIELLLDELPELNPDELAELLNSVHLGVLSLQTLIDNLLEGASIETGRFRVYPRPADTKEILEEAIQTMIPLAQKYGQSIDVQVAGNLPEVWADPRRTAQVMVNLISNAIKWNPGGASIRLNAERDGEQVIVRVADQGPGIPVERQQNVFQRFDRVPGQPGRAESGAGLGLSVVKAIVEAQGGQVGAANNPEGGAVFWFSLVVHSSIEESREPAL